jgi:hypothetical protein
VRVSGRAQAELRAGETLVLDWTSLAFCCAVAGEISLRPSTLQEAQRSSAYVPIRSGDGPLVFAHRMAYPMLVGRNIKVYCRRPPGRRLVLLLPAVRPGAAYLVRARDRT